MNASNSLRIGGLVYGSNDDHVDLRFICAAAEAACVSDLLLRMPPGLSRAKRIGSVRAARETAALPLTVDAETASVEEAMELVDAGADRVVVSWAALSDPELVERLALKIGRRGVVVAIEADYQRGRFELLGPGDLATGLPVLGWAARAFALGAGGFLLRGRAAGDTRLLQQLASGFPVPVASIATNTTPGWFAGLSAAGCQEAYADLRSVEPARLPGWERLIEDLVESHHGASLLNTTREGRIVVR